MREDHKLRVFENRMLRKKFVPKKDETTGHWRRLYKEELFALYASPSIFRMSKSRIVKCAWHVESMRESVGACRVLLEKP